MRTGTTVTSVRRTDDGYDVRDGRRHPRGPGRGDRQRRLQPADRAGVRVRRCRHRSQQLTTFDYRNPDQLPDGGVLVVGASATGVQLAAELSSRAGR